MSGDSSTIPQQRCTGISRDRVKKWGVVVAREDPSNLAEGVPRIGKNAAPLQYAKEHLEDLIARAGRGEDAVTGDAHGGTVKIVPVGPTRAIWPKRVIGSHQHIPDIPLERLLAPLSPDELAWLSEEQSEVRYMAVLLDTHIVFRALRGADQLSLAHGRLIEDHTQPICVSAVTRQEIAIKVKLGKSPEAATLVPDLTAIILRDGFQSSDITLVQAKRAGTLDLVHRDPFDRAAMMLRHEKTRVTVTTAAVGT
jgi:PIN domain nuclease of toxin-antitoxin system